MTDHEILLPHHFSRGARRTLEARLGELEGASLTIARTPAETREGYERATIALTQRLDESSLERAERLEWAQAFTAGYDHYDLEALEAAGIVLTNATGIHGQPMAEWALGAMLGFERGLFTYRDRQHDGVWLREHGGELANKTVGIVGIGAIGGRIAELAAAVGCPVIGTKRDPSTAPDVVDEVYPADELDEVLTRAEYLVIACPLTEQTRGMIDEEAFRTMPSEAVLVNVARGSIVDEDALVETLQQGRLAGAALDVFETEPLPADSPLWSLPNVVITPHISGSTPDYYDRLADIFEENYRHFVAGERDEMRNRIV